MWDLPTPHCYDGARGGQADKLDDYMIRMQLSVDAYN